MTIMEAINRLDALKPNQYTQNEKIKWLSVLDGQLKQHIFDTHEGEARTFSGYTEDTPVTTALLVEEPYDDLYVLWMQAQVDYANREYGSYSNSMTMFNAAYTAYERAYNRTHMPLGETLKVFS